MATSSTVIDAMRLGLEAAADEKAALAVVRALLAQAPESDGVGTESVRVLCEAVQEVGKWTVTPMPERS